VVISRREILSPNGKRSAAAGFTLLEALVTLAIAGVLIFMVVMLQSEMFRFDRDFRLNLMTHPELQAVLVRVRRDVLDADSYEHSPTSLILAGRDQQKRPIRIVYDFSEDSRARRLVFNASDEQLSLWMARGVPKLRVTTYPLPDGEVAVRLRGFDRNGDLTVDQVVEPRGHP